MLRTKLNWPTSPQDVRTVTDSIGPGNAALRSGRTCGVTTMSLSRHAHTNSDVVAALLRRSPRIAPLDERRVRWEVPGEAE